MPTPIRMPALSPTMEKGTLAKWHVKEGDAVSAGDLLAEIETDKATMEFEAVDEGTVLSIAVPAGTADVAVGTVIATLSGEDEPTAAEPVAAAAEPVASPAPDAPAQPAPAATAPAPAAPGPASAQPKSIPASKENRVIASPLARRIAAEKGVDLSALKGSGPNGRVVKADVEAAEGGTAPVASAAAAKPAPAPAASPAAAPPAEPARPEVKMADETRALLDARVPHTVQRLSMMRKTIARRLSQSMQEAPHIYLTVDVVLDPLLKLRGELNEVLAAQGVKLSVNDMLVKALGKALLAVPECNVTYAPNELIRYERADVSVAVSIPGGLITPIVQDASGKSLARIATDMADLAARAKEGKLTTEEYVGGTASLSNMGMMGIKQFTAVINPPQSTILAIGAGEKRPWVMPDGSLGVATVMSATGSFDHRAVDGADGARLMAAFKQLVEKPLGLVA